MEFIVPASLQGEHEELHEEPRRATQMDGQVGVQARALARLMNPHFVKEDQIALPPLGLLQALARGQFSEDMAEVLTLTDASTANCPACCRSTKTSSPPCRAAEDTGQSDIAEFARRLIHHARMEEEVVYPAAVLVGRYVRLRLGKIIQK